MDTFRLGSADLDGLLRMDSADWLPMADSGSLAQFQDLRSSPQSPTAVLHTMDLPPVIPLPGTSGAVHAFASDDSSGLLEQDASPAATAKAASRPKRGGTGGMTARSEQQKERIRAKNRRAQGRYREKKRAEQDQTAQVLEEVSADIERLRLENDELSHSNRVLERILDVRDSSVAVLEQEKKPVEEADAQLHLPAILQRLKGSGPQLEGDECPQECPLIGLSLSEVAAIRATSPEVFAAKFKGLVDRLRDTLIQVTDGAASEHTRATAAAEMREVLWEAGCMCFEHSVLKPTNMQRLLAASLDEGGGINRSASGGALDRAAASADAAHSAGEETAGEETARRRWAAITQSLELTVEQRMQLQPLRQVFVQRIGRVLTRRRDVLQMLQAAKLPDSLRALQGVTAQWLELNEASAELAESMQEEHVACMEFVAKSFGSVLTPLQRAKAIVASHPQFPDVYSIAVAADVELRGLELSVVDMAAAARSGSLSGGSSSMEA